MLLLAFCSCCAFAEITALGIEGRPTLPSEYAIAAAEPIALRVLLPANFTTDGFSAGLFQIAGSIAQPIPCEINIDTPPDDSRIGIVRLTPPMVVRVTRFALRIRNGGTINLDVFPAPKNRTDRPALADALRASRLKLAVCGRSAELRAFLSAHSLEFEDYGADAPDTLTPETFLIGELAIADWNKFATSFTGGGLLAFVDDALHMPGVYSHSQTTKVTLPLLSILSTDPRAEQTLFTILLAALTPPRP